jgi:RNA polymerase sigma-70 factor (ECF subfamily)
VSWELLSMNLFAARSSVSVPLRADLAGAARQADGLMDSEAFAAFYSRSARPLWAYLARVSGNHSLADDLMQESFVRFLGADRPELLLDEGEVARRKYLFRIASNLLRDHWRRPASASIDDLPEELLMAPDRSAQSHVQAIVGPALMQVSPRDRQLLWLAYAEGYSHREIAHITGLASASIRLLLFRARRRMAHLLGTPGVPSHGDGPRTESGSQGKPDASHPALRIRP